MSLVKLFMEIPFMPCRYLSNISWSIITTRAILRPACGCTKNSIEVYIFGVLALIIENYITPNCTETSDTTWRPPLTTVLWAQRAESSLSDRTNTCYIGHPSPSIIKQLRVTSCTGWVSLLLRFALAGIAAHYAGVNP